MLLIERDILYSGHDPCGAPFDESTRGCKGGPQNKSLFLTLMLQTSTNGNGVNNNPTFVIVDSPKYYQGK